MSNVFKVTVSRDLYVEASDYTEALKAVRADYAKQDVSISVKQGHGWKPQYFVDPKTKELISL